MRTPRSAFVPAAPLALPASPARRVTHRRAALCAAAPPPPRGPADTPGRARRAAARLPAALVAAAGALLGAFTGPVSLAQLRQAGFTAGSDRPAASAVAASSTTTAGSASSSAKGLRYDGRQELDSGEKALSMTLTLGAFAALGVWAWKQNRRDDELETVRIKDEVERLEKLRAEFVDVEEDDDSLDDEDLLASLKQRISEGDDADDASDDDNPAAAADPVAAADQPASESEPRKNSNGPATLDSDPADPDADADTDAEEKSPPQPGGNPDSVDMLRRMWDATDEDPKKDKS